jgi:hypothetical protein
MKPGERNGQTKKKISRPCTPTTDPLDVTRLTAHHDMHRKSVLKENLRYSRTPSHIFLPVHCCIVALIRFTDDWAPKKTGGTVVQPLVHFFSRAYPPSYSYQGNTTCPNKKKGNVICQCVSSI